MVLWVDLSIIALSLATHIASGARSWPDSRCVWTPCSSALTAWRRYPDRIDFVLWPSFHSVHAILRSAIVSHRAMQNPSKVASTILIRGPVWRVRGTWEHVSAIPGFDRPSGRCYRLHSTIPASMVGGWTPDDQTWSSRWGWGEIGEQTMLSSRIRCGCRRSATCAHGSLRQEPLPVSVAQAQLASVGGY